MVHGLILGHGFLFVCYVKTVLARGGFFFFLDFFLFIFLSLSFCE